MPPTVTGNAGFVFYPNATDPAPYTLDLGQCLSQYAEAPEWAVSDAVSLAGSRQRGIGGTGRRLTLTIQRIHASTARGREATAARLVALQNHLNRGGACAFSARMDKAIAVLLSTPPARGDTSVAWASQPFTALFGTQDLAAGDLVRLENAGRAYRSEMAEIATYDSGAGTASFAEEVLFTTGGPVLMTYAYCFPVLKRPADNVPVNITTNLVGRLWTMQIELVTEPAITWGIVEQGEGILGDRDPGEEGNGNGGITLDDPSILYTPSGNAPVSTPRGGTRPGLDLTGLSTDLSTERTWGF